MNLLHHLAAYKEYIWYIEGRKYEYFFNKAWTENGR